MSTHLETQIEAARKLVYQSLAEIEEWKIASGLMRGGDPDGVTPNAMRQYWEEQERQLALCKEALRGLIGIFDEGIIWPAGRAERVRAINLARELIEK